MKFGIDVQTTLKRHLIASLKRLKSTISVTDAGVYREDHAYSQVHIETTWTEQELDNWLWATKGIEAVGTFSREEKLAA